MARALMFQGTGSDVGKSLIVAGLARAFARRGLAVRPFKPQNMSNNAAVTLDGGEIGRAQALQARACGVAPSIHMNPVLLKPESEAGAQLVVQGRVEGRLGARDYQRWKRRLLPRVLESFRHMALEADLLLVEGAGSASEVNLRAGDIANMGFAEAAGLPVILIADIERGGAIASLVGTWALLDPSERARLKGYLVNKFRGDPTLFSGGIETVTRETGLPCLGIVPYFAEARRLPAEDSLALDTAVSKTERAIKIVVPRLPRLSNFDDLDPLIAEPDVAVAFVDSGAALPGDADLVVLPGSKATIADLASLRAEGWDVDIAAHLRRGGWLLGLCGGFQMLGRRLSDLQGVEGPPQEVEGLGLLEVDTLLGSDKRLSEATGRDIVSGESVAGYEMHLGRTSGPGLDNPFLILDQRPDGAVSADGRVAGCYLHGLFAADGFRHAFLSRIRRRHHSGLAYERGIEETLDRLAAHLEQNLELDRLFALASDVTIQDQPGWNLRSQAT